MPTTSTGPQISSSQLADAVGKVFALFTAHWPRKFSTIWKSAKEADRAKRVWFRAFSRCEWLTPETLAAGLERVIKNTWPPDSPGEFLDLCHRTPEMVGAPDVDAAFLEACRGAYPYAVNHTWTHACVYWAAAWTGLADLNERPNATRKRFERKYQEALDKSADLPPVPVAAIADRPEVVERNTDGDGFQSFLAAKRQLFGGAA